jgi:streptogramin lyase
MTSRPHARVESGTRRRLPEHTRTGKATVLQLPTRDQGARTEQFTTLELPSSPAEVRQLLGREGEVWGAESGVDKLVVVRRR